MPFAPTISIVWPPEAWDGQQIHIPSEALWCALKVNARCEKQVAREIAKQAAAYFLGMRTTSRVYQRRKIETQLPLFPGYVFAAVTEEQKTELWRVRNVAATLFPPSQDELSRELNSLCRLINSGAPLTPEEQLKPGDCARIITGSLAGLEGRVLKNCDGMRLLVGVTWLGQGVSLSVTPEMVERIELQPALGMEGTTLQTRTTLKPC
jgi:transcription antitermination factor NusG